MNSDPTKLSAEEWLKFLEPRLNAQEAEVGGFSKYYDGEQKLQMATAKFREAFARYFGPLANNWMQTVVDVPVSRLEIQGFRFEGTKPEPVEAAPSTEGGSVPEGEKPKTVVPPWELEHDAEAWRVWQANNLDSISQVVHTEAIKCGVTYLLVSPAKPNKKQPRITPESALECIVYTDPEDPTNRLAGMKRWINDFDERVYANIFLPDGVYKFRAKRKAPDRSSGLLVVGDARHTWEQLERLPNPSGVVPLVPIVNRPKIGNDGQSDLANAIALQDSVNKLFLDMLVASEFHAYPQRWAAGWGQATDDKGRELKNREQELFLAEGRMVRAESELTKFGAFPMGDPKNYLEPIELIIDHLAAQTSTPLYYLKGQKTSQMSADAMHAQDAPLVDRCRAKILSFSDGWEETMRVAFLTKGDKKRGNAESAEMVWKDPESASVSAVAQAAMVWRQELELPIEMCWQLVGLSPQEIRMARELMELPPGGGPVQKPQLGFKLGPDGKPELPPPDGNAQSQNNPTTHPNNQKGQPSGLASTKPSTRP